MNHRRLCAPENGWRGRTAMIVFSGMQEIRDRLNQVSPSFCLAKWLQVTLHLHSGKTHSCHHPLPHEIPLPELKKNPSALHNTEFKMKQRQKMLRGERPEECSYCWAVEDLNSDAVSDRILKSSAPWALPSLDSVRSLPWDTPVTPSYLEVSFSRTCNFSCSYCSPEFSTSWERDLRRDGPYLPWNRGLLPSPALPENENPYIQAFWEWWPEFIPALRTLRITGGEPLLSENTFRVMERLQSQPAPDLSLAINSNLGAPDDRITRLIESARGLLRQKKVRAFTLFTSIDGWGKQAEYIRHGLEFDRFWSNVERVARELPEARLTFMVTFNALSIPSFPTLIENVIALRKKYWNPAQPTRFLMDLSHLVHPEHQSIRVLPDRYREEVGQILAEMENRAATREAPWGIYSAELLKMKRIHEWMRNPMEPAALARAERDFYLFFSEHDRRRGTDFEATFPEFRDWWKHCSRRVRRDPITLAAKYFRSVVHSIK